MSKSDRPFAARFAEAEYVKLQRLAASRSLAEGRQVSLAEVLRRLVVNARESDAVLTEQPT